MSGIGLNIEREKLPAAAVIEGMNPFRVRRKCLGCGDIFNPNLRPDSIRIAKRREAGFTRDAGTGQNHQISSRAHRSFIADRGQGTSPGDWNHGP